MYESYLIDFRVSTMSESETEPEIKKKRTRDPVFNDKEDDALIRVSFKI